MDHFYKPLLLATAILTTPSLAQFGGFGGGFGGSGDGTDGFGPGDGSSSGGFGNGGFGFDISAAIRQRSIHGILASVAFVILFPLGAIAMATLKGRWALWVHVVLQMLGWVLFIVAAVLGFRMLGEVRVPGSDGAGFVIDDTNINYHPIIGIVLLVLLLVQPVLGWIHHRRFKLYQRRTLVSYLHLFNGRLLIILGMVNGGLGLQVADAPQTAKLAYTMVAALLGFAWLVLTVLSEARRSRGKDVWGRARVARHKNGVRMDRIDKAVRVGSERDSYNNGQELRYA